MRMHLDDVARVMHGVTTHAGGVVLHATADSRDVPPESLFFALPGARVDGHDFVEEAYRAGAVSAVVERKGDWSGEYILVDDAMEALQELTREVRTSLHDAVVGITGSSGKTCTKDFTAAVLSSTLRVHASPRSFNTEIGVPLTILNAPRETEALVLEMGSRGIGHIAALCRVARPNVGVVTNVGPAHLGMFGSIQNVAIAKGELVEGLSRQGVAVLNADDAVVARFADRAHGRVVTFGTGEGADVRAADVVLDADARASFTLEWEGAQERVELAVPGEHMVSNALAAAATGFVLGVSAAECAAALKGAVVSGWRMEIHTRADGVRVLNDAYNANPASMAAALRAARWMSRESRCIAVLGEMAELGDGAAEEHDHVGEQVARLGIEELVTVGEAARAIARGAVREGVEPEHVASVDTPEEALAAVRAMLRPGDVVVVKASRAAGLERVAVSLMEDAA